jgi:hypothetical protein
MKARTFMQKIQNGEETGTTWLENSDIFEVAQYALIDSYCDPRHLLKDGMAENGTTIFSEIRDGNTNYFGSIRPVYVAMNHGNAHFVLVSVEKGEVLHYVDSMSGDDDARAEMLIRKFPNFVYYEAQHLAQQKDGWSCGYRVAREILLVHGLHDHPLAMAKTSEQIRDIFVGIAKKVNNKYKFLIDRLFQDTAEETAHGKLTYVVFPDKLPFDFNYCDLTNPQNIDMSKEEIKAFCKQDEKYRHALLETGANYIYFQNNNSKEGTGPDGMGENAVGMALMEARNELFRENKAVPSLISNLNQLRERARHERKEVDAALGTNKTKGMRLEQMRSAFCEHQQLTTTSTKSYTGKRF